MSRNTYWPYARCILQKRWALMGVVCILIAHTVERAEGQGLSGTPVSQPQSGAAASQGNGAGSLPVNTLKVRQIRVIGSTVFSAAELSAITKAYVERGKLSPEDLEEIRLALTRYYVDRGYATSGAVLRSQTVADGILTYEIIEGKITNIEVENNRWFKEDYIRKRLALGTDPPVQLQALQERLLLLEQDPRIERLNIEIRPGLQRGESYLNARVHERHPFGVALGFDNYQSPSVGAERGFITLSHSNLTGWGDILSVTYGRSPGLRLQINASYNIPLNAYDTTLGLRYQRNQTVVVESPFQDLDIDSHSDVTSITLRHPVYRTLTQEFAVYLQLEYLLNKTSLLGMPFPFSSGDQDDDGKTADTALRLSLQWLHRTQNQVTAIRSRFSVGVDLFNVTINDSSEFPDGHFFAWLGQFQWVRRMNAFELQDFQLLLRMDVQLATEPLLPLEQIAVGGRHSVRGYRESTMIRDNAVIVSLESRIPLLRAKPWADYLELAPFFDFGHAENTKQPSPDLSTIYSIGIGLRWALSFTKPWPWHSQFEIYWGYPLKDIPTGDGNLQDLGLHMQLVIANSF